MAKGIPWEVSHHILTLLCTIKYLPYWRENNTICCPGYAARGCYTIFWPYYEKMKEAKEKGGGRDGLANENLTCFNLQNPTIKTVPQYSAQDLVQNLPT